LAEHYDTFVEKLSAKVGAIVPGDPMDAETFLGPLSSLDAAVTLQEQLDRAVAQGAVVQVSGARNGNYFPGAVLTGVTPKNDAHTEEFFGPVAIVYSAKDEAEAVSIANDTPFGLGSYLFTTDPAQALRVADQIDAGMVFVNGVGLDSPELPFGGVKRSGFGRELGRFGIEEFVNRKLIRILK
jgi:succinate-semialdehyde dehydrogenase/glutarate-semialdehyde dehydrogenase